MIFGIVITILFLVVLGPKIIGEIFEKGFSVLADMVKEFADWTDPVPFLVVYLFGYAIAWWKPLWGSIIIIASSIFYVGFMGFDGPPIFAAPAFLVGLFYLLSWIFARDIKIFKH